MDEHSIFVAALECESEQARSEFLREACGGDDALRERVTRLLMLHEGADDFLEKPVLSAQVGGAMAEGPGSRIGAYKLLEQIGEGGMGVVYMAAQQEPVKRKVALKIIKPGMDTRQVIARFEAERQALALMEHENIARVFDAGATESGRPYFVMELVRGIPVTDYCLHERLGPRQRLRLFIDVCHAVQHAHQKGIIHRDIKPSNVMITLHDSEPIVKMIDFGVAKATNQQLTDRTLFTNYAQMIGTPLYMSPEQAEMSGLDVDTRSDIYSLGVLLYELLTGTTPFEKERLKEVGYDEMRRIICEEDPPKPSTRLSTINAAKETISDQRRADARRMSQMLRRDLDWIVIKALDKNRLRRYQTAKDFADDVQRYLDGDPVEACPPSLAYRARKLLNKYRGIAAAVGAIGLLLVVGTIVATTLAIRATRAEKNAEQAQAMAENEAATATAISDFLRNELLGQASPYENPNRDLRLREVLNRASERIDGHFDGPPLVEAEIRVTLATTYYHLGEYKESARHFDRAYEICVAELGERDPKTLRIASQRAYYLSATTGTNAPPAALEKTLRLQEAALPPEHPDTLLTMSWLARRYTTLSRFDKAQSLFDRVIPAMRRVLGPEHPQTQDCLDSLARMYSYQQRYEESEKLHKQILESRRRMLGEDHPQVHDSLSALADLKMIAGETEQALDIYDRVVELRRRVQGEQHPTTLADERGVAEALRKAHRLEAAEKRCLETLNSHRQRYGEDDRRIQYMMDLLAALYLTQGRYEESLSLREAVLDLRRRIYGNDNSSTTAAMHSLAYVYLQLEQFDAANKLHQEIVDVQTRMYGKHDRRTLKALIRLAYGYQHASQFEDAERVLKDVAQRYEHTLGPDHRDTLYCVYRLGFVYNDWHKYVEAEKHYRQAWEKGPQIWGRKHRLTLGAGHALAICLRQQKRLEEATTLCREVVAAKRRAFGEDNIFTVYSVAEMAAICRVLGRLDEAAELSEQVINTRRKIQGDSHPDLFAAIQQLGKLAPLYEQREDVESAQSIRARVNHHLLDILKSQRESYGNEHENTFASMRYVADILMEQGQFDEALKLQHEIVDTLRRLHGPDDQCSLEASSRLAYCLQAGRQLDEAARIVQDTLERQTRLSGRGDPQTLRHKMQLAFIYKQQRKPAKAEELFSELWAVSPEVLGPEHHNTLRAGHQLAVVRQQQNRLAEAEPLCREVLATRTRVFGEEHPDTLRSLTDLAAICQTADRLHEARELLNRVINTRRRVQGDRHSDTLDAIQQLQELSSLPAAQ